MMLRISRRSVQQSWALYAGCFVAVAVGVLLLGLAASAIAAGNAYLDHHPGGLVVTVTGDDTARHTQRYLPEDQSPEGLQAVLGLVAGMCGFMTIFIVASTFAFVVAARLRELGLLRLVGATPRQIRRMILGEALIVAVAAAVAGSLLAYALTPAMLDLVAGTRFDPVRLAPPSPWIPLAVASGIGVVVALLGAWLSSRRAAKATPVDALRESATEPPRLTVSRVVFGLLGLGGAGTMLAFIKPGNFEVALVMAIFVPIVFVIGLVAWAPMCVPLTTRLWGFAIRRVTGVPGYLADHNVWAAPRRTGSLAAPIFAIAAIAGTLSVMMSFIGDLTYAQAMRAARPSLIVTSDAARDLTAELRGVQGVAAVDATRSVEVVLTDRDSADGTTAEGIDPATFRQVRRLDVRQGALDRLRGDAVAVTESLASDRAYHLGEPVRLCFLDGTAQTLTLVAIVADAPDLMPDLMLPKAIVDRHVSPAVPDRWIVLPATATDIHHLAADVRDQVGSARVDHTAAWLRAQSDEFRRTNNQGLLIILGPAGGYAGIAIVNTLLVGSLRRRREFVAARLLGATPRQIRQMILCESSLVGLAALSIAGAITATVSLLARPAMMAGVRPVTTTVPWLTLGAIALTCVSLAVAAALAPAARVLRDSPPSAAAAAE
jgi:putative ABC transport system permease protein